MRGHKRYRGQGGFTLTELMITIALIGTMSAIAIPNFLTFQARSRRSEAYSNLAGLARAYKSYGADRDVFPDMLTSTTPPEPSLPSPADNSKAAPDTVKMPWDAKTKAFFDIVGWQSDGPVYYSYDVKSGESGGCSCTRCFTATAHGDVDGDGNVGALMYVHPQTDNDGNVIGSCNSEVGNYGPPIRNQGGGVVITVYDEVAARPGPY